MTSYTPIGTKVPGDELAAAEVNQLDVAVTSLAEESTAQIAPSRLGSGTPGAGQYVDGATGEWTDLPTGGGGDGTANVNIYVANADQTWPSEMVAGTSSKPTLLFANLQNVPDAQAYPAPPLTGPFDFYYGPTPVAQMPTVAASVQTQAGRKVTFLATPTPTPGTSTISYAWTFTGGGTGTGSSPTTTFPTVGTKTATVMTTDTNGVTATSSVNVTVTEGEPTVSVAGLVNGSTVEWTATATDPEGEPITYAWTGTDSLTGTTAVVPKTYASGGTKSATVTVTDSKGLTANATGSVNLVEMDANGIITSDDFSGTAADGAALLARSTSATLGGYALKPSDVSLLTSAASLDTGQLKLTGNVSVSYPLGLENPRIRATLSTLTSTTTGRLRFHNGDQNTDQISAFVRGNGEIVTDWKSYTNVAAPSGTFTAGDTLEVQLNCATGLLSVLHIRGGTTLNTYTRTGSGASPSYAFATLAQGAGSQTTRFKDLVVGEVRP